MSTFVTLATFTDQGARAIKSSPDRFLAYKQAAEAAGVSVRCAYWTEGDYDLVIVTEGPEDAVMSLALKTVSLGNVHTQTLRAYSEEEMRGFVAKL